MSTRQVSLTGVRCPVGAPAPDHSNHSDQVAIGFFLMQRQIGSYPSGCDSIAIGDVRCLPRRVRVVVLFLCRNLVQSCKRPSVLLARRVRTCTVLEGRYALLEPRGKIIRMPLFVAQTRGQGKDVKCWCAAETKLTPCQAM